ncbi:hypothetical protein IOCL2690_000357000 [Leishmania lindenbergi]|uniref:Uncharacterized protein n=2 Tax=Leishmania TaxID=5658 RepID=A0AAW3ALB8_9TRYP
MTRWNQRMAKMAFRRSKFRRLAWGDGDPYPYTPRATFRYQWDDWPMWEKMWHLAVGVLGIEFAVWAYSDDPRGGDLPKRHPAGPPLMLPTEPAHRHLIYSPGHPARRSSGLCTCCCHC